MAERQWSDGGRSRPTAGSREPSCGYCLDRFMIHALEALGRAGAWCAQPIGADALDVVHLRAVDCGGGGGLVGKAGGKGIEGGRGWWW